MTGFGVYIRRADLQSVDIVEEFVGLTTVESLHAEGRWQLDLEGWSPKVELLREPGAGITVRDEAGRVLFGGPCLKRRVSYKGGQQTYSFIGADDNVWLSRRQALPAPSVSDPSTWTAQPSHDVHSGSALTSLLHTFVADQLGADALTERQVALLEPAADPVAGPTDVAIRARLVSVLSVIEAATTGTSVVAWVRQQGEELVFTAAEAPTREGVLFTPDLGELEYDFEESAPEATAVYVAGAGELEARLIRKVETTPPTDWPWRFEAVYDQRSEDDAAALVASGEAFLAERGAKRSLRLDASDVPWVVRDDFDLGDTVTVMVDGHRFLERVREVEVRYGPDGQAQVNVTVGTGEPVGSDDRSILARLFRQGRRLSSRLSSVEAQ